MRPTSHPRRIAAATLAMVALAAPAATARPMMDRPIPVPADRTSAPPVEEAGESFDWSAAGIGAATTTALVLVATGGFAAVRRGSPAKSVG